MLNDDIEEFIEWILKHHKVSNIRAPKLIHDNVWGTELYSKAEIALINIPLIQRLRRIGQTGLASFTYPSATHNRFSHSLGVYTQVKKLIKAVVESGSIDNIKDKNSIQFAALLHDIGHGPFSHLSEEIYKRYPEIEKAIVQFDELKVRPKAHELLSFLLIKNKLFKEKIIDKIEELFQPDLDIELIANSVIGYSSDPLKIFKVEFINGPFDADKLDYLIRDGLFSGLPLHIDLERLWFSVNVTTGDFGRGRIEKHLTIKRSSVAVLEQIVFAKMILFMNFYHHQKIRAVECLYKAIIEYIQNNG